MTSWWDRWGVHMMLTIVILAFGLGGFGAGWKAAKLTDAELIEEVNQICQDLS